MTEKPTLDPSEFLTPAQWLFVKKNIEAAQQNLTREGNLLAVALVVDPEDDTTIVPMVFRNEKEKVVCFAGIRALAARKKAQLVLTMVEGWGISVTEKEWAERKGPVSDQPDKHELLAYNVSTKDFELGGVQIFDRDKDGKPVLRKEVKWTKSVEGRLTHMIQD